MEYRLTSDDLNGRRSYGQGIDFPDGPEWLPAAIKEARQHAACSTGLTSLSTEGYALCLGARGVGIGRGLPYPLGAYGQPGVESTVQLLQEELERGMRLLGVRNVGELHAGLVTADSLAPHSGYHIDGPREALYEPLEVIAPEASQSLRREAPQFQGTEG
ncbi:mitochondrial cytochrome [Verticillium dahliae]